MNEIEVGEYIRTEKGLFGKCTEIYYGKYTKKYFGSATLELQNGEVIGTQRHNEYKHSKNIIDLIEVGDYVNGHKVVQVKSMLEGKFEVEAQAFLGKYFISYEDIETIVTKEQFNSVMYKVVE